MPIQKKGDVGESPENTFLSEQMILFQKKIWDPTFGYDLALFPISLSNFVKLSKSRKAKGAYIQVDVNCNGSSRSFAGIYELDRRYDFGENQKNKSSF